MRLLLAVLFVAALTGAVSNVNLAMADEDTAPHLFDDINGNGVPDDQEEVSDGSNVPGGAQITDPGDGDGYIENP